MDEPSPQDVLFWEIARKSTKLCFFKCVGQVYEKLTSKQEVCIRDCANRYLECREVAINSLKELAKHG
jgi:Tim10/DDP family zinc finger.